MSTEVAHRDASSYNFAAEMLYGTVPPGEVIHGFVGGVGVLLDIKAAPAIQEQYESGALSLGSALGNLAVAAYEQNKPTYGAAAQKVRQTAALAIAAAATQVEKGLAAWRRINTDGLAPDLYRRPNHRKPNETIGRLRRAGTAVLGTMLLPTLNPRA